MLTNLSYAYRGGNHDAAPIMNSIPFDGSEDEFISFLLNHFPSKKSSVALFDGIIENAVRNRLYNIACQAWAFGLVPDEIEYVILLAPKEKKLFTTLLDLGMTLFFDNCTGLDERALVRDRYLMPSSRCKISNPPKTDKLLDLIGHRMILDSCVNFVYAISMFDHPHLKIIAKENVSPLTRIATLGRYEHKCNLMSWELEEFEKTADNNVKFLELLIKYAMKTEEFKTSLTIDAAAKIWARHLANRHMGIRVSAESINDVSIFLDTASAIGIADSMNAYYNGIPVEDILA